MSTIELFEPLVSAIERRRNDWRTPVDGPPRLLNGTKKGVTVEYLQNFDITNQMNILRLICGLFFVPHIYAKFFVPEALGFFIASGVKQPKVWLYAACVIETLVALGLIFAIFRFLAALLGCLHLLVALSFVWKVTKGKWLWNIGGYEYCLFWAICCLIVAMDYYRGGHLFI